MTVDKNELNALIHLLDDPDEEIFHHVHDKLMTLGMEVIPSLENFWENSFDPIIHERIEDIIHDIQFDTVQKELKIWRDTNPENLLLGTLIICKFQYPDLNVLHVIESIEKIKKEIWVEMNYDLTPLEQVNIFNHVLYTLNNFGANTQNIQDPQNCYLNKLLETKKGNPISLGILYLVLASQIQMPVYGVNLPQHFILSYHKNYLDNFTTETDIRNSILFYINPFNRGIIFSREDINMFLKKLALEPKAEHYIPCNNIKIVSVLIQSLISTYELSGSIEKVNELVELKKIVDA